LSLAKSHAMISNEDMERFAEYLVRWLEHDLQRGLARNKK